MADGIADHIKRGVPVVGADGGVTIPLSKAQKVQDPGGAIAPYAGFEIPLGLDIAFTPIIQPQYAAFGCEGCTVYSITSLTAGAWLERVPREKLLTRPDEANGVAPVAAPGAPTG